MNRASTPPDLSIENKYSEHIVAGIDEVGRGAWAGPVVTGAVIIKDPERCDNIVDSKQTSSQRRTEISAEILSNHHCGIGVASVEEIYSLGLNPAIFLAMERSLNNLPLRASFALVDGNYKINLPCPSISIIKGDQKSISIAAASIIAKVYRDNLMKEIAQTHPHYAWEANVGYGTSQHIEMLRQHGVTAHHRKNFKPIRELA